MLTSAEALRLLRIVAQASGASISESESPTDTVATLRFPVTEQPVAVPRPVIAPGLRRVLHVEDGDRAADLTHYYLRDIYAVDAAQDAEEALRMALETPYDVILMDMNLGRGMDGFQLTGLMRQIEQYAKTPIIALTGYAGRKDAERCIAAGCTAYLAKPFLKEDLLRLLQEIEGSSPMNKPD